MTRCLLRVTGSWNMRDFMVSRLFMPERLSAKSETFIEDRCFRCEACAGGS